MKYIVELLGRRIDVVISDDGRPWVNGREIDIDLINLKQNQNAFIRRGRSVSPVSIRRDGGRGSYVVDIKGNSLRVEVSDERSKIIKDLAASRSVSTGVSSLAAPMPGLVVRVMVSAGDIVEQGQGLVVVEAMKMENELRASGSGRVVSIRVEPGNAVEKGAMLIELEPL